MKTQTLHCRRSHVCRDSELWYGSVAKDAKYVTFCFEFMEFITVASPMKTPRFGSEVWDRISHSFFQLPRPQRWVPNSTAWISEVVGY